MKYFIFSDVHGYYSILKEELKKVGFDANNENHMLISLGDNFDRGKENYQMFQFLKEMNNKNKIILIKGNHEDLLMEMFSRGSTLNYDHTNGTYATFKEFYNHYFNVNNEENEPGNWIEVYKAMKEDGFFDIIYDMKDYYETNNYVFTHGFIPIEGIYNYFYNENCAYNPNWRNSSRDQFKEARWYNSMELSIKYNIKEPNKKIVAGHFHSSYGNVRKDLGLGLPNKVYDQYKFSNLDYFLPYEDENIIAIDSCVSHTKILNVLIIED